MLVQSSFHRRRFLEELARPSLTWPEPSSLAEPGSLSEPLPSSLSEPLPNHSSRGTGADTRRGRTRGDNTRGTASRTTSGAVSGVSGSIESKVVVLPNGIGGIDTCDGTNDLHAFAYGRYYSSLSVSSSSPLPPPLPQPPLFLCFPSDLS